MSTTPLRSRFRLPASGPSLPAPAGPLSARLLELLTDESPGAGELHDLELPATADGAGVLGDDDFQLALYVLYELHYRGFAGVDERWEWDPALLAFRRELEDAFELALEEAVAQPESVPAAELDLALRAILDGDRAPSLSRYIEARATREQFLEFVIHRSAYQLKEADPHSWAIARLSGAPKAALVTIQADEYGDGVADRVHAQLFATTMEALGLDARYGGYLEQLPGVTLATVNLMSLFGLQRRRRGAIVGHLAAFEMSSSLPNRRYANGLERLGFPALARGFYDEHVVADAVHENIAAVDLAGGLAHSEPQLADDILFGAAALVELDARFATHLLDRWEAGASSLR